MDTLVRPAVALPDDFEQWSKPARWLLRTLVRLPTWEAHGFAVCTDEQLAEWRQCDPRTIRRMRQEANARGEIRRIYVRRGAALPDGQRVRHGLWILVAGDAQLARVAAPVEVLDQVPEPAGAADVREVLGEIDRPPRTNDPREPDSLSADRSVDPLHSNEFKPPVATEEPTAPAEAERSTSFHEVRDGERDASDERAARAIATHYAKATGKRWRGIHAEVLAFVMRFVREMVGSEANKVRRANAVIDRVVAESTGAPTLRYVFHDQIFWRRLEKLTQEGEPQASSSATPPRAAAPRRSSPAPLVSTDEREEIRLALAEFHALSAGIAAHAA